MTKQQILDIYPDAIFTTSATGREIASVPLSEEDKNVARSLHATYVEDGDELVKNDEANENNISKITKVVAVRRVLGMDNDGLRLGGWTLTQSDTSFFVV